MTDMMLTMGSRTTTSEDLFLLLFWALQRWRPTLVKTFETSNELIDDEEVWNFASERMVC